MSKASPKRKASGVCEQPCGMRPTRCVCIAARDRLVEALIPPSTPLGPYKREEMMLEFSNGANLVQVLRAAGRWHERLQLLQGAPKGL